MACNDTNRVDIFVFANDSQAILIARLDNLGKGASGAAVQAMNVHLGVDEGLGPVASSAAGARQRAVVVGVAVGKAEPAVHGARRVVVGIDLQVGRASALLPRLRQQVRAQAGATDPGRAQPAR